MVWYLVLTLCAILTFVFVLQPLFHGHGRERLAPARLADLLARREYLIEAIHDVDFDFSTGKVAKAEYFDTRDRFIREAAVVLRELESESSRFDRQIDNEIAQLRELARGSQPADGGTIAP